MLFVADSDAHPLCLMIAESSAQAMMRVRCTATESRYAQAKSVPGFSRGFPKRSVIWSTREDET